jgi:hypothetical protein
MRYGGVNVRLSRVGSAGCKLPITSAVQQAALLCVEQQASGLRTSVYFSCFLSYSSFVITLMGSSFLPASLAFTSERSLPMIA